MIVFENHSCQITGGYPNENFLVGLDCEQPKWVVDDNSETAKKILSSSCWEPVKDENGKLTDVTVVKAAARKQSEEDKISALKAQLDEIDRLAIRPLRAIAAGTATDEDRSVLAELEMQAEEIRAQMAELNAEKEGQDGHTDNKSGA
jgi:hypothetical protein